ncbi:TIGR03617 family F420-dependent LLM class oxidoreductase [Pseudonocardia sp. GCM10023141]|uniref:TIGR03617 family F420-dependent LLM class oxidoreductase n=1 Tax=Pseudonocardia sp. GCM10023141 TaxID=3252653 RepID=UPI003614B694
MQLDIMKGPSSWAHTARVARAVSGAGLAGIVFTETTQTPWMSLAQAASVAPELQLSTGIAVAFPRSPMVTAAIAWELAGNTGGRFRLGLGTQVRAHVERRYSAEFDHPGPRLRDYVRAVRACFDAFAGRAPLAYDGEFYRMSLLPDSWRPEQHAWPDIKIDVSAVGDWMCAMAGEVADGIHVHPLHSLPYLENRLLPAVTQGCARAGRPVSDVDLIVPVFVVGGDTAADRAPLLRRAKEQIAFYGSTRNYAFQFDDLGFTGLSARLNTLLKAGDLDGMRDAITDDIVEQFAVVGRWDDIPDALVSRYAGRAARLVSYLAEETIDTDPLAPARWGAIARAIA